MNDNNAMTQHIEKLIEIAEKCKQVYDSGYISGAEEIFLRLSDAFLAAANAYTDERAVSKFGDTMTGPLKFKSNSHRCGGYINRVYSDNPAGCGIDFGSSDDVDSDDITKTERCGIKFMHSQTKSDGTRLPLTNRVVLFATDDRLYKVEYDDSTKKYTETGTEMGFDTRYDYQLISEENNPVTDKGNQVYEAKYYDGKNYISIYYCAHKAKKIRQFEIWGRHNVTFDSLTSSKEAEEGVITDENILRRYKGSAMKRDANGRSSVMGPVLPKHIANKEYVDAEVGSAKSSVKKIEDKITGILSNGAAEYRVYSAERALKAMRVVPSEWDDAANKKYVDDKVATELSKVINGAPEALDTLLEISEALKDDDNAIAALTNTIADNKTELKGYADNKAAEAETAAKAYADSLISPSNISLESLPESGRVFVTIPYGKTLMGGVAYDIENSPNFISFILFAFTGSEKISTCYLDGEDEAKLVWVSKDYCHLSFYRGGTHIDGNSHPNCRFFYKIV